MELEEGSVVSKVVNANGDFERRMNRYEREVAHLTLKNERMAVQLRALQKEKDVFDDSVKDLRADLASKTARCTELQEKLTFSEESCKSVKDLYAKMLSDSILNVKEEERQRLTFDLEKARLAEDAQKEQITHLSSENENLQECLTMLHKQYNELVEKEKQRQTEVSTTISSQAILIQNSAVAVTGTAAAAVDETELQRLRIELEQKLKECSELNASLVSTKSANSEQIESLQLMISQKESQLVALANVHAERFKEIEALKDSLVDRLRQSEEVIQLNKVASEEQQKILNAAQEELLVKSKEIVALNSQVKALTQRNNALEDSSIPTEADSILEVTLKSVQLQKQVSELNEKNRSLTAQLEYLQKDLKQKLPQLNLRKNDYQTMHTNYQALKVKLGISIKSANQLITEKQQLHDRIDELLKQKEMNQMRIEGVFEQNVYLSFLLDELRKLVLGNSGAVTALEGVNVLAFTVDHAVNSGFSDEKVAESFLIYKQEQLSKMKADLDAQFDQQNQVIQFIKPEEHKLLVVKAKEKDTEISRLQEEVAQLRDKIEKLESMDAIRNGILGDAQRSINRFEMVVEEKQEVDRIKNRLKGVVDEREELKRELSKRCFELSRLRTELAILNDIASQTQRQADLYSQKYEQILKSQLKENTAFEAARTQGKALKKQVLESSMKNAALQAENERLQAQIEQLRHQVKQQHSINQQTSNYLDAVKKKKLYFDRDTKSLQELQNLRAKVQEQSASIVELRERNLLDMQVIKQKLQEQEQLFAQKQVTQNIQIENYRLLSHQATTKMHTLNRIILDQEKEIKQLRNSPSTALDNSVASEGDAMIEENFLRLDTQLLKNLNKMEQIVRDQKQQHQDSLQSMQETMQKLADTCIGLSEKLKEAEAAGVQNAVHVAQLEKNYLAELDKKQKEQESLLQEKESQIKVLETRFEEYRAEQQQVQQEIRKQLEQESVVVRSTSVDTDQNLKEITEEKQKLEAQLVEIKAYLTEIATERLVIEAAQQAEIKLYVMQMNSKAALQQHQQQGSSASINVPEKMEIEVDEKEAQSVQFEQRVKELIESEEKLRNEISSLTQTIKRLEEELATAKSSSMVVEETNQQIKVSQEQNEQLTSKVAALEADLVRLKQEKDALEQKMDNDTLIREVLSSEDVATINQLIVANAADKTELLEKLQKYMEMKNTDQQPPPPPPPSSTAIVTPIETTTTTTETIAIKEE